MKRRIFFLVEIFIRSIIPPFYSFSMFEKLCEKKLMKDPRNEEVLWFLSYFYVCYKKYNEAKEHLETLIKLGKDTKNVRLLLSRVYFNLELYAKVEEILTGPGILSEKDKENYYLGISLIESNKFEDGIRYLKNYALNYRPKNYLVHVKLGYAYYKQESYFLALEAYEEAYKLSPQKKEILDSISLCNAKLKESSDVREDSGLIQ